MQDLLARLRDTEVPLDITGINPASAALFLARAAEVKSSSICCIFPSDEELASFSQDVAFFSPLPVFIFPSTDTPPYSDFVPDPATTSSRIATLYQLQEQQGTSLILCSVEACRKLLLPRRRLLEHCELIISGEETDREAFISGAIAAGYQQRDMVRREGEIALRGGIIDIYPPPWHPSGNGPLRLDFFGDTIESIRQFDLFSQRSLYEIKEAVILPVSEVLLPRNTTEQEKIIHRLELTALTETWDSRLVRRTQEQLTTQQPDQNLANILPIIYGKESLSAFFDYLPTGTNFVLYDATNIIRRHHLITERISANFSEVVEHHKVVSPPVDLYLDTEQFDKAVNHNLLARLLRIPDPSQPQSYQLPCQDHNLLKQEISISRKKEGLIAPLSARLSDWSEKGHVSILSCRSHQQAQHIQSMLERYDLSCIELSPGAQSFSSLKKGGLYCVAQPLSHGFDIPPEQIHFLSALELFGDKRLAPKVRKRSNETGELPLRFDELQVGSVVVHRLHGIARFQGLVNMEISGQKGDFLLLHFRNDDKLYVPIDKLPLITKYHGISEDEPKLDSLGSSRWAVVKKKINDAVWEVAQELLAIYAKRALQQGHSFYPPGALYHDMEESFPYDETRGQSNAINDVLQDMMKEQPMDRLICGDVGYGKTEVAARAVFKAVEDGFQAAILVPTTVLAEQHAVTLSERFAHFPISIACLNRFRTASEQKKIRADLAAGQIDVIIGTHRLLSKDISYHKLGLLIVDEEHRFGVTHKEKIKKIKATVDVLTLTATPIPRTLQMSLLGIRDLSVISTPPQDRRPVKTYLASYEPLVIKEAGQKELERGGQIYFIHNRVQSIMQVAAQIHSLLPQARVGVAHGQMPATNLEEVMVQFVRKEIDILVCTTIVESGLDITNANTVFIDRADRLGLADLYQLRGRVGRGSKQSYAYLLVPSVEQLNIDAEQRLQSLLSHSDLGGGFQIAMNDLQIRGGGNLLGVSQSGHIAAVGYDLYLQLLQDTITELKETQSNEINNQSPQIEPEIKLKIAAFFPDYYIRETGLRYQAYRKLASTVQATNEDLTHFYEEIIDRFGPMPLEAEALFALMYLKQKLTKLRIEKLEEGKDSLVIHFSDQTCVRPETILSFVNNRNKKKENIGLTRFTSNNQLIIPIDRRTNILNLANEIIQKLEI